MVPPLSRLPRSYLCCAQRSAPFQMKHEECGANRLSERHPLWTSTVDVRRGALAARCWHLRGGLCGLEIWQVPEMEWYSFGPRIWPVQSPVFQNAAIPGSSRITGGHWLSVASRRLVAAERQRRRTKLTSAQRSFEGLLVSLAVSYLGERLALFPAQTESMRRIPKWENGQDVQIIWDT